jgi:hypothetical protein
MCHDPRLVRARRGHDELVQAHTTEDLEIDPNTAIPAWRGEAADYARIVEALCAIEDRQAGELPEPDLVN